MRYQPPTPPRPTPTVMATATLRIIKLVVNRFGGKAVPSDFAITIRRAGSGVQFKPIQGADGTGAVINLAPGTYDISETPTLGYRGIWSGLITAGGRVLLIANQTVSVTRTNFDMGQSRAREATPTPTAPSPSVTKPPNVVPPPNQLNPNQTVNGGVLPRTSSPSWNLLSIGLSILFISTLAWVPSWARTRRLSH